LAEIQNPNQGGGSGRGMGGDSKSLFGFMIVFVLMVVAFQVFGPKKSQQQPAQQKPQTTQGSSAVPSPEAGNPGKRGGAGGREKCNCSCGNVVQAAGENETVVENELYRITFTNRGGAVKSWVLKKYRADDEKTPLDLVNHDAAAKLGLPMTLYTYDAGLRNRLNTSLYLPSETGTIAYRAR